MSGPQGAMRTWSGWLESFFIPDGTENDETYAFTQDPSAEHDGYQMSAHEEENEQLYRRELASTSEEDFDDVTESHFMTVACRDQKGRPVVLVVARRLPADIIDAERIYRYVIASLDDVVTEPYSVVYIHTGISLWKNFPGALWLRSAYERLALKYKQKLHKFFILHSDLSLWLTMSALCPFMSHGFWQKVSFAPRVEFLWEHIDEKKLGPLLPSFVRAHDDILEEEPLHDYGYVKPPGEMSIAAGLPSGAAL